MSIQKEQKMRTQNAHRLFFIGIGFFIDNGVLAVHKDPNNFLYLP